MPASKVTKPKADKPDRAQAGIGYVIRRLCGLHDVAPSVLAEYIGTRKAHISNIMTGRQGLQRDNMQRIAGAFAIPVGMLSAGNLPLTLAAAFLRMDAAPITRFEPTGDTTAEYLNQRRLQTFDGADTEDDPADYVQLLQAAMTIHGMRQEHS